MCASRVAVGVHEKTDEAEVMDIVELMQKALDKTNDHDAIFALDKGITEIERLREALEKEMAKFQNINL